MVVTTTTVAAAHGKRIRSDSLTADSDNEGNDSANGNDKATSTTLVGWRNQR